MCGVAALFAYHYSASNVDRDELRMIRDHMRSRGPDGSGEWFSATGRVALGHRRLSIIDLSDSAAQPMASADGALQISYNGEVYNYRELRARLESNGAQFRTRSDTEVLLALYEAYGDRMFEHIRGMYAFALWDERKGALLLGRDPYGIKPLYIADDGWTVRIASQVKALLSSRRVSRVPDLAGRAGFYLFGSVPDPFTVWLQVRAVPAGSFQWIDALGPGSPVVHTRIAECFAGASEGHEKFNDAVQSAVRESVAAHRVADVEVGAFLSGGIDSSTLVSIMAGQSALPIRTSTIEFEEFRGTANDEAPLAASVAMRLGVDHQARTVTESEFQSDLPRILTAMDQPSIDGINTWFAAKAVRERGLRVAVSGIGGDELFGGYDSFVDVPRWRRMARIAGVFPGVGAGIRRLISPLLDRTRISRKAAGVFELGATWSGAYLLRRGLFMPWELPDLMGLDEAKEGLERLRWPSLVSAAMPKKGAPDRNRVGALESNLYLRNQLLRDTDWAAMAHGIEVRTPLVDAALCARLAPRSALAGKSALASAAMVPLPGDILTRRKTGFSTPVSTWLERSGISRTGRPPLRVAQHWSRELAIAVATHA